MKNDTKNDTARDIAAIDGAGLPGHLLHAALDLVALADTSEVADVITDAPKDGVKAIAAALRLIRCACDEIEADARQTIENERAYVARRAQELEGLTL